MAVVAWLMVLLPQFLAGPTEDMDALELQMVARINVEREARGIPPLERRRELTAIARSYSRRMAATGKVKHEMDRPLEERIKDALPNSCMFGENVSKHTNIEYSIGDMMASEGHRENLLDTRFEALGVGIVRGDDFLYFTLEFARLCEVR